MRIEVLPVSLAADAIGLWHETGLTRPWNDPDADLRRVHGCGVPKIQLMVRSANAGVIAFYEQLGYEASDVAVLGKFLGVSPER